MASPPVVSLWAAAARPEPFADETRGPRRWPDRDHPKKKSVVDVGADAEGAPRGDIPRPSLCFVPSGSRRPWMAPSAGRSAGNHPVARVGGPEVAPGARGFSGGPGLPSPMSLPPLDVAATRRQLVGFLRTYAEESRAQGFVLGVSGGVDSAVVAALAKEAVGAERVLGLLLPHRTSDPVDAEHGELVCRHLGIPFERVDVTPVVEAAERACAAHPPERMAAWNLRPRVRMMLLYAHAHQMGRLVLGTGNKSELLTGYFTKWGDGAADVYPLGDLYKTQVWDLARDLGIPPAVVEKPPTAGLFPGQTDEGELGVRYADLDRVLAGFEAGHDLDTIARRAEVPPEVVRRVEARILGSAHKRNPLVIPKVGFRTPGWDWREPRHRAPSEGPA